MKRVPPRSQRTRWLAQSAVISTLLLSILGGVAPATAETAEDATAKRQATLDLLEERIQAVLSQEQAEQFASGVPASEIHLANGETLGEFLHRVEREQAAGLVYKPVRPCVLLDSSQTGERLEAGESRSIVVRGFSADYSDYGGAEGGCGIPGFKGDVFKTNTARALFLTVELLDAEPGSVVKLWPASTQKAPNVGIARSGTTDRSVTTIVSLCDEESRDPCTRGDLGMRADNAATDVAVTVLGYFELATSSTGFLNAPSSREETATTKALVSPFWEEGSVSGKIHYSDGKVGIGTDNPKAPLHIIGPSSDYPRNRALIIQTSGESPKFRDHIVVRGSSESGYGIAFGGDGHHRGGLYARNTGGGENPEGEITLWARNNGNIRLFGGKVGINQSDPEAKLHVNGRVRIDIGEGLIFQADNNYWGQDHDARRIRIRDGNGSSGNVDGGVVFETWTEQDDQSFPLLSLRRFGGEPRVGIGSAFPGDPLSIHGYRNRGTGTLQSSGTTVTGAGTSFDTELRIGSEVVVNGQVRRINSIAGPGQFQVNKAFFPDLADEEFWYAHRLLVVDGAGRMRIGPHEGAPEEQLQVEGSIKLSGNIVSDGDICIGNCG